MSVSSHMFYSFSVDLCFSWLHFIPLARYNVVEILISDILVFIYMIDIKLKSSGKIVNVNWLCLKNEQHVSECLRNVTAKTVGFLLAMGRESGQHCSEVSVIYWLASEVIVVHSKVILCINSINPRLAEKTVLTGIYFCCRIKHRLALLNCIVLSLWSGNGMLVVCTGRTKEDQGWWLWWVWRWFWGMWSYSVLCLCVVCIFATLLICCWNLLTCELNK